MFIEENVMFNRTNSVIKNITIMPKYLNPENIFPKRLGLMHGNTLVL